MSILSISQKAAERKTTIEISTISNFTENDVQLKNISIYPTGTDTKTSIETALGVLFSYIPTEIIALYIAVVAAIKSTDTLSNWITFYIFLACTPIVVWLLYAAKVKKATGLIPLTLSSLPLWELIASTLAFVAWAFALPDSVFQSFAWYNQSIAGVSILLTSTVLGLISPFFDKS